MSTLCGTLKGQKSLQIISIHLKRAEAGVRLIPVYTLINECICWIADASAAESQHNRTVWTHLRKWDQPYFLFPYTPAAHFPVLARVRHFMAKTNIYTPSISFFISSFPSLETGSACAYNLRRIWRGKGPPTAKTWWDSSLSVCRWWQQMGALHTHLITFALKQSHVQFGSKLQISSPFQKLFFPCVSDCSLLMHLLFFLHVFVFTLCIAQCLHCSVCATCWGKTSKCWCKQILL